MSDVRPPLHISSRLMAALDVPGAGTVHVHAEGRDAEGRVVYRYLIESADGAVIAEGDDLRSGVGAPVDYADAVRSLLSFLGHAEELYRLWSMEGAGEPDGGWPFGSIGACEWAYMYASEIGSAMCGLGGVS